MIRKLTVIAFALFISLSFLNAQSTNSINGTSVEFDESEFSVLNSVISKYTLFEIDILKKDINTSENNGIVNMTLGDDIYRMRLYSNNVKVTAELENLPHLLGGIHSDNGVVSLTINDEFIYGFIREGEKETYIEPLWYFEPDQDKNIFVVYDSKNAINTGEHTCGVTETEARTPEPIEKTNTTCREVDLAIANDFFMFTSYNTTTGVTNHNLGVLNNVQTNYNCVFNDDLFYNVVTIFIPTTSPDPFTTSTNAGTVLSNFRTWAGGNSAGGGGAAGATGGFGTTFDMAAMWTDRDFAGSTVGIAYLSNWFHVNQDFTTSATSLRVVWAHEMGHNWSAGHDASGAPFIMAPSVGSSNSWSANSISTINNRINSQSSSLPPCGDLYQDNDGDGFGNSTIVTTGGVNNNTDCDDTDATVFPGAPELCDGIINDCNATFLSSDEIDNDNDGYVDCSIDPAGWQTTPALLGDDCNDLNNTIYPTAPELCDGLINDCNTTTLPVDESDDDGDGYVECSIDPSGWQTTPILLGDDCDDTNPNTFPGANEICDMEDNNCDGAIDEGLNVTTLFEDNDGDGFGDPSTMRVGCDPGVGFVKNSTDCDDTDATVYPGAPELCDGQLNDCNSSLPITEVDDDNDGYVECTVDAGGWDGIPVKLGEDCDDTNPNINPGATEVCDGIDNNCDGQIDEGTTPMTYYDDNDSDGYGAGSPIVTCSPASNQVLINGDCDDTDPAINPGAAEVCDGVDNNCDNQIDEGLIMAYYDDNDGDGFGTGAAIMTCMPTAFQVLVDGDCDDTDPLINPNATEICDGVDNNCDGQIDENGAPMTYFDDNDGDGFGAGNPIITCTPTSTQVLNNGDCDDTDPAINPNANGACDGVDNNCDGIIDFGCQPCDDINLFIDNNNIVAINRAEQTIDSDALVNLNSVLYTAGNNIELIADFEVAAGKVFEARIEPCIYTPAQSQGEDSARNSNPNDDIQWAQLPFTFEDSEVINISVISLGKNTSVINLNGENQKIFLQLIESVKSLETGKYTLEVKSKEKILTKTLNITSK